MSPADLGSGSYLSLNTSTFCIFVCFCFLVLQDRVSLCSRGCPVTHFVDQAGHELRNSPASASRAPPRPAHLPFMLNRANGQV